MTHPSLASAARLPSSPCLQPEPSHLQTQLQRLMHALQRGSQQSLLCNLSPSNSQCPHVVTHPKQVSAAKPSSRPSAAGAYWAAAEPQGLMAQLLAASVGQTAWTWMEGAWTSMAVAVLARAWRQGTARLLPDAVQREAQARATAGPTQQRQRGLGGGPTFWGACCV